ncbi:MAG: hypothetical protein AAGB26_12480 [Planctomycetota bacterium]
MFRHATYFLLLAILFGAAGLPSRAQEQAAAVEPEAVSVWIPCSDTRVFNRRDWEKLVLSDGSVLSIGDAKVGRWVEKSVSRAGRLESKDLGVWVKCVGHYRIDKAGSMLTRAAQKLVKLEPAAGDNRDAIFYSLAQIAGKRDVKNLKRLLEAPIVGNNPNPDAAFLIVHREWLAAALLRLGDEAGRKYLYDEYRKHMLLKHTKQQNYHSNIAYILNTVYDPTLVEQIEALIDHEELRDKGEVRNEINRLVSQMKVNGLPLKELRRLVEQTEPLGSEEAIQPVHALAERGGLEDLKLIERICQEYEDGTRRGGYTKKQFELARAVMRCRLWKQRK